MLESAKHRLLGLAAMSDGEFRRAWPMGAAYACILASLYVLKPARNSLFLTAAGPAALPLVLLMTAACGAIAALVFTRLTRRLPLRRLALWVLPVLSVTLIAQRGVLDSPTLASNYAFYIWVNLYGHLATAILWLMASDVFDAREARRVFGFLGAMGIMGAVIGGGLTQLLSVRAGTLNLLWVAVGLQVVAAGFLRVRRHRPVAPESPARRRQLAEEAGSVFRDLKQSGLLRALALLSFCGAIVSCVVDVQFNILVDQRFTGQDQKTAFFGSFFAALNLAAFAFQLFVSPRLLARFGLAQVLWLLPAALALGSTALLIMPALVGGLWLKSADIGLRHSAYKSGYEMLFVPLRSGVKKRARVFIDAVVDNLGTGIGAALVWVLLNTVQAAFYWLGLLSLAGGAAWAFGIYMAQKAYVAAFRQGLSRREIRPDDLAVQLSDPLQRRPLVEALSSPNPRQVRYALDLLSGVRDQSLVEPLLKLLEHEDSELRSRALNALGNQRGEYDLARVQNALGDPSPEVRREALYLLALRSGDPLEEIKRALSSEVETEQLAALGCVARYLHQGGAPLVGVDVQQKVFALQGAAGERARSELARALGATGDRAQVSVLRRLALDPSPLVVEQAILALGALGDAEQLDWLVSLLSDRKHRRAATLALQNYGDEVVATCGRLLMDPLVPSLVRQAAGRILTHVGSPLVVAELSRCVTELPPPQRLTPLKALSKLRSSSPGLVISRAVVRQALATEAEFATRLRRAGEAGEALLDSARPQAIALCFQALTEKRSSSLERTFRLLGLIYPPPDVYKAFLGIQSPDLRRRARAIEFLDNLITRDDRPFVFPFVETSALLRQRRADRERGDGLRILLSCEESWLRACAVFAASPRWLSENRSAWDPLLSDPNGVVRQAADAALERVQLLDGPKGVNKESARSHAVGS